MGDKKVKFERSRISKPRPLHGTDKAGAGDLGKVDAGDVVGKCPSCGAELRVGRAHDPRSQTERDTLLHTIPFCTYFGETSPEDILKAISK